MLPKGKFDGVDTAPMFELKPSDAGSFPPPPPPPPFGRGEKTYARVWCPCGAHLVRVIDDGQHLRYATHWPVRGTSTTICTASERCTAEFYPPHLVNGWGSRMPGIASHAVCSCGGAGHA